MLSYVTWPFNWNWQRKHFIPRRPPFHIAIIYRPQNINILLILVIITVTETMNEWTMKIVEAPVAASLATTANKLLQRG